MFSNTLRVCTLSSIVLLAIAGAGERPEKSADKTLTARLAKTGLYVISGGGGNSLLRLSANGFILVDGKLAGNYDAILALTKKLSYSDQPIRALILTGHYGSHRQQRGVLEGRNRDSRAPEPRAQPERKGYAANHDL